MLSLIEHLPAQSHYLEAMSLDEEYIEAIAAQQNAQGDAPEWKPRRSAWSAEAEATASVVDAVRVLTNLLVKVNSEEGAPDPKFVPYPRPRNMLEKAKFQQRLAAHKALSARLLARPTESTSEEA